MQRSRSRGGRATRSPIGIPADTLRQRPDIRATERNLAAADRPDRRRRGAALSGASAQRQYRHFGSVARRAVQRDHRRHLLGAEPDPVRRGRLRSQLRAQQAATEGALAGYRQSILAALEDVENALVALNAARARQAQFAIALEAANNTAILARTQYRSGLTDFRQLLESERSLLSARDGMVSSRADEALALVQLYRALGGGWMPARPRQWKETMAEPTTTQVSNEAELEDFLGAPAAKPWYKRPLYIVGAVVAVLALLLLSRCFVGESEGGYATAEVRRGQLSVTVSATGNLQPTNQVEVGSEQSGLVTEVYVDNNDRVVAGQPLARLDTSRLQDTILQAQAGLAAAQAQVATAEATAAQARAGLARQEEVFRLSGGRVPSETELDAARPRTGALWRVCARLRRRSRRPGRRSPPRRPICPKRPSIRR